MTHPGLQEWIIIKILFDEQDNDLDYETENLSTATEQEDVHDEMDEEHDEMDENELADILEDQYNITFEN